MQEADRSVLARTNQEKAGLCEVYQEEATVVAVLGKGLSRSFGPIGKANFLS